MKTGQIRQVDDTGRIVIPKKIRTEMDLKDGTLMEFDISDGKLIVERYIPTKDYKIEAERLRNYISKDTHLSKEHLNKLESLLSEVIEVLE